MSRPLAVFVGSSSEALRIARTVKTLLKDTATVKLWNQPGIFRLSNATLESLDVAVTAFDFGVFVFSSDDDVTSRHKRFKGTRDNVLFELGLFMGRLGRDRTFVVSEDKKKLKILSDFLGVGTARYEPNGRAFHRTIRAACVKIRREMADRGQRRGTSMKTIEYGIDISASPYNYKALFRRARHDVTFVGTNLRSLLLNQDFNSTVRRFIGAGPRRSVTLICATPPVLGSITRDGLADLRDTIRHLLTLRNAMPRAAQRRLRVRFHPDAVSLGLGACDAKDAKAGLIVLSPRWAGDIEPSTRPFFVVHRADHREVFQKVIAGVLRMIQTGSISLDDALKLATATP